MSRLSQGMTQILIQQAINEQRNSNIYASMANNLAVIGYTNSAKYMSKQSNEEREHFQKIWNYLIDRNAFACLDEIPAAPNQYTCPIEAFNDAMLLEFGTTAEWKTIYDTANAEGDVITHNLALEFMEIQKIEEEEIMNICDELKLIGANSQFLILWDKQFEG